jgi:hypothetical protein
MAAAQRPRWSASRVQRIKTHRKGQTSDDVVKGPGVEASSGDWAAGPTKESARHEACSPIGDAAESPDAIDKIGCPLSQ